MFELKHKKMDV
jgi:hypothetical protein